MRTKTVKIVGGKAVVTETEETISTYSLADIDNIINSLQIELANENIIVAAKQAQLDFQIGLRTQLLAAGV